MLRSALAFVAMSILAGPVAAGSWAEDLFDEPYHDFGPVAYGALLRHDFQLTNHTAGPVHIASVRVSCGCVSTRATQDSISPGKTGTVVAQMDTSRFHGVRRVTIFVQLDQPQWEEVRLAVQADSRGDLSLNPEVLTFGKIKRGSPATARLQLAMAGGDEAKVREAKADSGYVRVETEEVGRDRGEVRYQVTAQLQPGLPVGSWYTDIWLETTNAAIPRVRVPVMVEIEPALSVSPAVADWGQVKAGAEVERKVLVRGTEPFRIVAVKGTDSQLTSQLTTEGSRKLHVVTLKLKAGSAGELRRSIRVVTDLREEKELTVEVKADVVQ
jgi:hypothetical protein